MHYMYFIHGKIYFIVDEIAIDSCETIYSTKEGGPEHTASIMPIIIICTTKTLVDRFWQGRTNFGNQNQSGGTIFAAIIGPPGPILGGTDFAVTGAFPQEMRRGIEATFPYACTRMVDVLIADPASLLH